MNVLQSSASHERKEGQQQEQDENSQIIGNGDNNLNQQEQQQPALPSSFSKQQQQQQQPMNHFHTKDFKAIGLSPQKVKLVIDNIPYIEELAVHRTNEKTTRLQTKYRVSTDRLKKEFLPQQAEIVLNINSKVYGTQESPDKNYMPYEQYQLRRENERLQSELELKEQRICHLEEMMKSQSQYHEQVLQLTNANSQLVNANSQLNQELMKFRLSMQETIYARDSHIKDLEDKYQRQGECMRRQELIISQQQAQIESLTEESSHTEVIQKLQKIQQLRSASKYTKSRLQKEFHGDIIALDLINAFYGLLANNNNNISQQQNSNNNNNNSSSSSSQKKPQLLQLSSQQKQQQKRRYCNGGGINDGDDDYSTAMEDEDVTVACQQQQQLLSSSSSSLSSFTTLATVKKLLEYHE